MTAPQALALCAAALTHGNGQIDLTNRAALQLRGVRDGQWRPLIETLVDLELVEADPAREARRLLLVDPDWVAGDDSHRVATELLARVHELPALPGKIGYAVDAGPRRMLHAAPGDFRIERAADGGLILRLDGRAHGVSVPIDEAVTALIALAHWFVESGGAAAGRAVRHRAPLPAWAEGPIQPAAAGEAPCPGPHRLGAVYGLPFGQVDADRLAMLVARPGASAVRLTPWRLLLVEGLACDPARGFVTDPASPLMRIDACAGAPACPQGAIETRTIARRLAPCLSGRSLHVSGCAKGCARAAAADIVVTGHGGRFGLSFGARASDPPHESGFDPDQLLGRLGAH